MIRASLLLFVLIFVLACGVGPTPRPVTEGPLPTAEETAREAEAASGETTVLYETSEGTRHWPDRPEEEIDPADEDEPADEDSEDEPADDDEPSDDDETPAEDDNDDEDADEE